MDIDTQAKVLDLEDMDNDEEGTITLHFTPTRLQRIDKVFLLDFVSERSRASLYIDVIDDKPYLAVKAEGDEEIEWKERMSWRNNERVFIAVSWDLEEGKLEVYVDEEPFQSLNLEALGFERMGRKVVIGSDYKNHYPGNFDISM